MRPVATSYFAPCQGHTRHPSLSIRPLARSAKRCRHRLDTAKSCPLEFPTAYRPAPTTLPGVSSDAGPTLISSAISYLPGGTERDATPPSGSCLGTLGAVHGPPRPRPLPCRLTKVSAIHFHHRRQVQTAVPCRAGDHPPCRGRLISFPNAATYQH